eukprot:TRINITY_DN54056_c0_g1_i1.p1 TRINITY_DN54056_c0_g1~~TRINITY_DN54056_c0_g1_i1.p1  ORF type:complete len:280 (+),score=52.10 TRINITY_DN54056_c0_g1_i1:79-840(+)
MVRAETRQLTFRGPDDTELTLDLTEELWGQTNTRLFRAAIELARTLVREQVGKGDPGAADTAASASRVVELGCGLGLPGIACCKLGADVTLCDRWPKEHLILKNASANLSSEALKRLDVRRLRHGERPSKDAWRLPADHVIAADLLYDSGCYDTLLSTMHHLSGAGTKVWVAFQVRSPPAEASFFAKAVPHFYGQMDEVMNMRLGEPGSDLHQEFVRIVVLSGPSATPPEVNEPSDSESSLGEHIRKRARTAK